MKKTINFYKKLINDEKNKQSKSKTSTTKKRIRIRKLLRITYREIMFYEVWFNNLESISIKTKNKPHNKKGQTHSHDDHISYKQTYTHTNHIKLTKVEKLLLCFISIETKNMSKYISIHISSFFLKQPEENQTICIIFMFSIYILYIISNSNNKCKEKK